MCSRVSSSKCVTIRLAVGTDSLNLTAAQILLNTRQRRGFGFAVFDNLKLLPVLKMFFPSAVEL